MDTNFAFDDAFPEFRVVARIVPVHANPLSWLLSSKGQRTEVNAKR